MKAAVWHGKRDVRVDTVPDPTIEEPTDAIVRITSTGLCGSDLHLYEVMGPFMTEGDILGHEPMGIVEAVGSGVTHIAPVIGSSSRSTSPAVTASCAARAAVAVRDDPGPRARQGRRPLRLHEALRPGARRPGRAAAGPPGPVRTDQGAPRSVRRPLRLPLRRPADGVAGRAVRRHPRRRDGRRARSRPDRLDGLSHRHPPRRLHRSSASTSSPSGSSGPVATAPTSSTCARSTTTRTSWPRRSGS